MEKTVSTIAGPFDRLRYKSLCKLLDDSEKEGLDRESVVMFEGQELLISSGQHLRTFLDKTFASRNHGGL